ncbi:MAG TPA: class I SAM-dependent methyltransferase, partial [Blastocatellia bacterium]|nr:class I SAM-dependent methyltransferase [Blastocatellia bacterium]
MTAFAAADAQAVRSRARHSQGSSAEAVYRMAASFLADKKVPARVLWDIGCGRGNLWNYVRAHASVYCGVDAVRYEGFPEGCDFIASNLDGRLPLPDSSADTVASIETIEHLENPRAFVRELRRIAKPGGWIIITTPNQLSLLSKCSLVVNNQFNAFQEAPGLYPAHLTALVEIDLVRI